MSICIITYIIHMYNYISQVFRLDTSLSRQEEITLFLKKTQLQVKFTIMYQLHIW